MACPLPTRLAATISTIIQVKDINLRGADAYPMNLTNVNGTLFFTADDGSNGLRAVEERRHRRRHRAGQGHQPRQRRAPSPTSLTNVNGTLFFTANDGTNGTELWKSDGTAAGTVLVKDINPGSGRFGSHST